MRPRRPVSPARAMPALRFCSCHDCDRKIANPPDNDVRVCTNYVDVEITPPDATGTVSGSILP